jgi:hypothetical protein
MRYQNRNLVNLNYNINKFISNLDSLLNFSNNKTKNIIEKYKENTDYFFGLLSLLKLYKENEEIYKKLLSDLSENNCNKEYYYSNLEKIINGDNKFNPSSKVPSPNKNLSNLSPSKKSHQISNSNNKKTSPPFNNKN